MYDEVSVSDVPGYSRNLLVGLGMLEWMLAVKDHCGIQTPCRPARRAAHGHASEDIVLLIANMIEGCKNGESVQQDHG